jgi:hypothetical protein
MSIADYLIARATRTPYFHLKGYMLRYWLVPYKTAGSARDTGCGIVSWRRPIARLLQACGIAVRVHVILRSDNDRALHDHPWNYVSVILKGSYVEVTPGGFKLRKPGSIAFRRATDKHRLVLVPGESAGDDNVVTLFITTRSRQSWGFFPNADDLSEKIVWDKYLGEKS